MPRDQEVIRMTATKKDTDLVAFAIHDGLIWSLACPRRASNYSEGTP